MAERISTIELRTETNIGKRCMTLATVKYEWRQSVRSYAILIFIANGKDKLDKGTLFRS